MPENRSSAINPWIVTIAVMLATFMEVLDTTVVNVSIPHMAGNLGATYEEGTWVVTSYLVSNAIILPMAGWLANRFGRRRMLMSCVTGFTLTSLLCGMATSLECADLLPRAARADRRRPAAAGAGGAAGNLPAQEARHGDGRVWAGHHPRAHPRAHPRRLDHRQLHLALDLLHQPARRHLLAADDQPVRHRSRLHGKHKNGGVDLWGIGFLALGFGMLQMVLDTGQRKDWFGSNQIRLWTALCVIGLVGMVIRELTAKHPIVDLRVLKDRTFAAGIFLMTMLGFVLYAA